MAWFQRQTAIVQMAVVAAAVVALFALGTFVADERSHGDGSAGGPTVAVAGISSSATPQSFSGAADEFVAAVDACATRLSGGEVAEEDCLGEAFGGIEAELATDAGSAAGSGACPRTVAALRATATKLRGELAEMRGAVPGDELDLLAASVRAQRDQFAAISDRVLVDCGAAAG